ncbi:MAG: CAP domain-containing protein [Syntrophorhabdaceae bacterium]
MKWVSFAVTLVALAVFCVLVGRGQDGTILQTGEAWADAHETIVTSDARRDNSRTPGMKGAIAGSRLTVQEVRQLLAAHNAARAEVGTSALTWSASLALYAQEWADHLASTVRRMEHRPHSGKWKQKYGENLFMGSAGHYGSIDAVALWKTEKSAYHGEAIHMSNFSAYGHYTQLIWRNTRSIGCGKAQGDGNMFVVCNYDPPGNVLGQVP